MKMCKSILSVSVAASLLFAAAAQAQNFAPPQAQDATHDPQTMASLTQATNTAFARHEQSKQAASKLQDVGRKRPKAAKPETLMSVQVLGSLIPQSEVQSETPITTVTAEQLARTGQVTIGAALQQLPSVGASTSGSERIDLRGIGASRTLVLIDGQLAPTTNGGTTDVGAIPVAIVQKVEILNNGASTLYGSSAVGGVVDIITKQRYNGLQLSTFYGQNDGGDGTVKTDNLLLGTSGRKGSVMMDLSYRHSGTILDRSRAFTRFPDGKYLPNLGLSTISPLGKFTAPDGKTFALNQLGLPTDNINNYHEYTAAAQDKYNSLANQMWQSPDTQKSIYLSGNYHFTSRLQLSGTALYTRDVNRSEGRLLGLEKGGFSNKATGITGLISPDSIYNPIDEPVSFIVGFPNVLPRSTGVTTTEYGNAVLAGSFGSTHLWNWNASATYSAYRQAGTSRDGVFNLEAVQNAIGPSFVGPSGEPECGTPSNVIAGCIPWNVLAGSMTAAQRNALLVSSLSTSNSRQVSFTANVNGGVVKIPTGGTMRVAFGVQRQNVYGADVPSPLGQTGITTLQNSGPSSGSYHVDAAYGEVYIPVLKDLPAAHSLAFDLSARDSRYSTFGNTIDGKYGFAWRPVSGLLFRGSFSQSFRAPPVSDLFGGTSVGHVGFLDPCDSRFGAVRYGEAVHEACLASLRKSFPPSITNNFRQLDAGGVPVTQIANRSVYEAVEVLANPDLKPETGLTRSLGFVYSPSFVPGLDISLDWYYIHLSNTIGQAGGEIETELCYSGELAFCKDFSRNPVTGQVDAVTWGIRNIGSVNVQAYDFDVGYLFPERRFGQFKLDMDGTYLTQMTSQFTPVSAPEHMVGVINTGGPLQNNQQAYWRLRDNITLNWRYHSVGAMWRVRYFSPLTVPCTVNGICNEPDRTIAGVPSPGNREGATAFSDVSFHWNTSWRGTLTVGVNNIFDKRPPYTLFGGGIALVQPEYPVFRFGYVQYTQRFR